MIYTVGEMAQKRGVPASTLRYYDKEGLLHFVERSSGGIRMFRETDFEWLQVIRCMKKAGMSIKDIRQYIELSMQGAELRSLMYEKRVTAYFNLVKSSISNSGQMVVKRQATYRPSRRADSAQRKLHW